MLVLNHSSFKYRAPPYTLFLETCFSEQISTSNICRVWHSFDAVKFLPCGKRKSDHRADGFETITPAPNIWREPVPQLPCAETHIRRDNEPDPTNQTWFLAIQVSQISPL